MRISGTNASAVAGMPAGRAARWSRRFVSIIALAASMAALALIVEGPYGQFLFGSPLEQALGDQQVITDVGDKAGQETALSAAEERRYRALSSFVANRYRVSQDVAYDLVGLSHRVGHQLQLDPLLIIAVIAVESSFNPIAESVAGAKGLMQIIPKYHGDKLVEFGGERALYDPVANIQVGALILKEYIRSTGHLGSALQMYAGALGDNDDQYSNKVLGVKQRLQYVASKSPVRTVIPAPVKTAAARNHSAFALPLD